MKTLLASLIVLFLFIPLLSFGEDKYPVYQEQEFVVPSGLKVIAPAIVYLDFPPNMPIRGKISLYLDFYSQKYNLPYSQLADLITCESNWRIDVLGDKGKALGIFQWWESSWDFYNKKYKTNLDRNNWQDQIELSTKVLADGGWRNWKNCWQYKVLANRK